MKIFRLLSIAASVLLFLLGIISSCGQAVKNTESGIKASEENLPEIQTDKSAYIIPLINYSDPSFKNSDLIQKMIFNSFYSFMNCFPGLNVPAKSLLIASTDISNVIGNSSPDYLIYGSYVLHGNKSSPDAEISINVKSRYSGEKFSNTYNTPTDLELFDTIDKMTEDIGSFILKQKARISHLNFSDLEIGPYEYSLFVNNRHVADITNNSFSLDLNILSGKPYHVVLIRNLDSRKLINEDIVLNPGESTNISYKENVIYSTDFNGELKFDRMVEDVYGKGDNLLYLYKLSLKNKVLDLLVNTDPGSGNFRISTDYDMKSRKSYLHFEGRASRGWNHLFIYDYSYRINTAFDTNVSIIRLKMNIVRNGPFYGIYITDANFEEFYYKFTSYSTVGEWAVFSIPINKFKSLPDSQGNSIKLSRIFNLPVHPYYWGKGTNFNLTGIVNFPITGINIFDMGENLNNYGDYDINIDSVEFIE